MIGPELWPRSQETQPSGGCRRPRMPMQNRSSGRKSGCYPPRRRPQGGPGVWPGLQAGDRGRTAREASTCRVSTRLLSHFALEPTPRREIRHAGWLRQRLTASRWAARPAKASIAHFVTSGWPGRLHRVVGQPRPGRSPRGLPRGLANRLGDHPMILSQPTDPAEPLLLEH